MRPARLIVTRPHHELGRDAVYDLIECASAAGLQVDQLPDMLRLTRTPRNLRLRNLREHF